MTSSKKESITRRKLVKGAAGAALCCTCLPLGVLADSAGTLEQNNEEKKKTKMTGAGKEHLAAACGTYCGACPACLAKHGEDEQIKMKLQKRSSSGPAKAQKGIPPSKLDGWPSLRRLSKRRRACWPLPKMRHKAARIEQTE